VGFLHFSYSSVETPLHWKSCKLTVEYIFHLLNRAVCGMFAFFDAHFLPGLYYHGARPSAAAALLSSCGCVFMGIRTRRPLAANSSSRTSAAFFSHARAFLRVLSPHCELLFPVILICAFAFTALMRSVLWLLWMRISCLAHVIMTL
jgi:hypothetical protein